jgi:hypothetical protein
VDTLVLFAKSSCTLKVNCRQQENKRIFYSSNYLFSQLTKRINSGKKKPTNNYICRVFIYDLVGNLVMTIRGINSDEITFERHALPPGFYYYKIMNNGAVISTGKIAAQ